ncbi:MAG: hypothetical protein JO317_04445 [Verrucomicrobiae bacterium]|nr:hypothetical protein [Verrucomicrobiae bacterium]
MAARNIYIDVQNRRLVASSLANQPISELAPFTLADEEELNIYLLQPTGSIAPAFTFFEIPVGMTFKLGVKETTAFQAVTYLAFVDSSGFSTIENGIACKLSLNTSALLAKFNTTDDSKSFNFELEMKPSGDGPITPCRWLQPIRNQVIDDAIAPTPAGPTYLTEGQTDALMQGGNSGFQKYGKGISIPAGSTSLNVMFSGGSMLDSPGGATTNWHFRGQPVIRSTGGDVSRPVLVGMVVEMRADGFKIVFGGIPIASDYVLDYQAVRDPGA